MITVVASDQTPENISSHWNPKPECLSKVQCFLASWIAANEDGTKAKILTLWLAADKPGLETYWALHPETLQSNASAFASTKQWYYLGWIDYGEARVALLVKKNQVSAQSLYVLPLMREDNQWRQSNILSGEKAAMVVIRIAGEKLMEKRSIEIK